MSSNNSREVAVEVEEEGATTIIIEEETHMALDNQLIMLEYQGILSDKGLIHYQL